VRTRDYMAARGPDGLGAWASEDDRIGLGHRRLAIIDLSEGGAQPMSSADGNLVVTFNGEIYNFRELRRELEAKGSVFRSQSDTEVLLELYGREGTDMVRKLRGMFAFAIWDRPRRRLVLARDPYGIKPLYYADDGWTFRFASQVKALLAGGAIDSDADPAGAVGFFLFGSVPEPFSCYRAIRAVPAGSVLVVDSTGAGSAMALHSIAACYADAGIAAPRHCGDDVRDALLDSVRNHLVADVPVGAFLSAGIDSGALVGLMRDAGASDIKTATIGFAEFAGKASDESVLAAEVAAHYRTSHATRVVTRAEFEQDFDRILAAMDQPTIDGINTWFVAKATREHGLKVAISGLGGDELFGGYPSFRDVPRWVRAFSIPSRVPHAGKLLRAIAEPIVRALGASPKAAGLLELGGTTRGAYLLKRGLFMPWELDRVLPREVVDAGLRRLDPMGLIKKAMTPKPPTAFGRVAALESSLYMRNQLLRDTDWASMAHSLEVRVPLVDSVLLERLAPFAGDFGGAGGKQALAHAPSKPLPAGVVNRAKTGFTTPIESWMRAGRLQTTSPAGPARAPWAREWSRLVGSLSRVAA
jgi:asparagine synthase (glutamine-hydrolysing)